MKLYCRQLENRKYSVTKYFIIGNFYVNYVFAKLWAEKCFSFIQFWTGFSLLGGYPIYKELKWMIVTISVKINIFYRNLLSTLLLYQYQDSVSKIVSNNRRGQYHEIRQNFRNIEYHMSTIRFSNNQFYPI